MPRCRSLPLLFLPAAICGQQLTFATYQGGSGTETTAGIVQDSLGNLYLAGSTTSTNFPATSTAGGGFVTKLSSMGAPIVSTLIPGVSIAAVALDASNNLVVAGTNSTGGFVSKLNSALTQTLWTATFKATPTALALDSSGSVYVTGYAQSGFATTTGAYQTAFAGVVSQDVPTPLNAFVLKLSSDGSKPIYATYLGGETYDVANAIAVDSTGDVYLTGITASTHFPVTAGAAQSQFGGALPYFGYCCYGDAFAAKLDAKGATLLYATYLGGAAADQGTAIAVDANGNAYIVGATSSATWLMGAANSTYQTTYAGPSPDPTQEPDPDGDAFLVKLSLSGSLAWYTYLGGSGNDNATSVSLDAAGNIYLAGDTDSSNFPVAGNPLPDCHLGTRPFLAEFNATGAKLLSTTGLSGMGYDTVSGFALDTIHNIAYIAGDVESQVFFSTPGAAQANYGGGSDDSFVSRLDLTVAPALAASCVVNAASFMAGNTSTYPTGAVAPGEIVSLFGVGLGPTPYVTTQLTAAGLVSTSIGGMTVLFDGLAAPLLFAGNGQINAVVPYGINSTTTNMTVKTATLSAGPIPMPVDATVPAIFLCGAYCNDPSQAAVLNSDYSLNTAANPATRGDFVTFFMTGAGLATQTADGAVTSSTTTPPQLSPTPVVTIRGAQAQVLYAGPAPGDVSGALQVTVVVPTTIDFGSHVPLSITIGDYSSQENVTIAVQ